MARRLEWAKQHLDYTWTGTENLRYPNVLNKKVGWVDIDEKWWDMLKKRLMKVHPGQQEQTRVATKSKRFVQKVMGLCAVARLCGDFNGSTVSNEWRVVLVISKIMYEGKIP